MSNKYYGNASTQIRLLIAKIHSELNKSNSKSPNKKLKNSFLTGSLSSKSLEKVVLGLDILESMVFRSLSNSQLDLFSGQEDVSKIKNNLINYKDVIDELISRLNREITTDYYTKKDIEQLPIYSKIIQAARDGILLKRETRHEIIDGVSKEITYDTPMSAEEVMKTIHDHDRLLSFSGNRKLENYIGIGFGIAGIIGSIATDVKSKKDGKSSNSFAKIGFLAAATLKLLELGSNKKGHEVWQQIDSATNDLYSNEQVSSKAELDAIKSIEELYFEEKRLDRDYDNKKFATRTAINLLSALISGVYISKNVQIKEDGKIDGKSLATALATLQASRISSDKITDAIKSILNNKNNDKELKDLEKKLQSIMIQMDKKVFPLKGAEESFDSFEIKDFHGKFYPKRNYENKTIKYGTRITIPEFSVKRGDIVLLSGESGAGKSTLLRLLKRGDINNRNCITLDNGKTVDNLGSEYISFRPNMELGNENNVLFQLTGKSNISDLSNEEKEHVTDVLTKLHLDFPNLLEQLASKKFLEFSTGQQKRLALSKLFYRIKDASSVIIVDEPVGNVEDSLIKEQLKLITEYAKENNLMLILTTHRTDLAEDLVNKRYHINNNGILEQVPIKSQKADIFER